MTWERKGEYSDLKLDGNNNSTMVRYESNNPNSAFRCMDIVCQGRTRFDFNIRPSLANRDSFKNRMIEIGEKDSIPGDWGRKVFADRFGTESTEAAEYPPANIRVNIGDGKSITRLLNVLKSVKDFSPANEVSRLDEIQNEILYNIDLMKVRFGKRSRTIYEGAQLTL